MSAAGAATQLLDIHVLELPIYNPEDDEPTRAAVELIESCHAADGLPWSSPALPGPSPALKNALDWLRLLGDRDPPYLHDKVIGLISTAGGTQGLQAINTMEFSVRALRWAVLYVVPVASASRVFDGEGQIQDETVELQLRTLGSEVVRVAERFASIEPSTGSTSAIGRPSGSWSPSAPIAVARPRKDRYEATGTRRSSRQRIRRSRRRLLPFSTFGALALIALLTRPSRRRHNRSVWRGKAFVLSAAAIALAGAGAGVLLATHGGSARAVRTTGDAGKGIAGFREEDLRTARRRELQDPEAAVGPPAAVCPCRLRLHVAGP